MRGIVQISYGLCDLCVYHYCISVFEFADSLQDFFMAGFLYL